MKIANCKLQIEQQEMTPEGLLERLLSFAARVGKMADALPETRLGRHIAGQIVRCGTSPAPNYSEACAAESRADFVHKLSIVLKELRESCVWLQLIIKADLIKAERVHSLHKEGDELSRIIGKSVVTARAKSRKNGDR